MKKVIVILCIVLGISLVGVGVSSVLFIDKNNKLKTNNKEVKKQEDIIKTNQKQINELKEKVTDNEIEIKKLEESITKKDKQIKRLDKKYNNKKQEEDRKKQEKIKARDEKIKDALQVPPGATCKIKIGEKYFWEGTGMYVIHVDVEGTGYCKGYFACADFTLDYSEACTGITPWGEY